MQTYDKPIKIAHYGKFYYEEPCISNENGCGAIFFSGCSLKCVYCQNYQISSQNFGKQISVLQLVQIIKELESLGVYCINLVNPTHVAPFIFAALDIYRPQIPVVWNSHGYESLSLITKAAKYVDIFLPDLKYADDALAQKYSHAPNYFLVATKAISFMCKLKPNKFVGEKMTSGVIVRHLVLPNNIQNSKAVLEWIDKNIPNAIVSVMSQYIPSGRANQFAEINRTLIAEEYQQVLDFVQTLHFDGFTQELDSATPDMVPKWDYV